MVLQDYLPPLVWPLAAPPPTHWESSRSSLAGCVWVSTTATTVHTAVQLRFRIQLALLGRCCSNGTVANPSPPTAPAATAATAASAAADFLALYDRCVSNGFKARINISNTSGLQEITLTCHLPAAIASAQRRRCRRPRQLDQAASAAALLLPRAPSWPAPAVPSPTRPEPPPLEPSPPELLPPKSPLTPSLPPAKRRRKAAKRCCKAELLRGMGVDKDLCLSPRIHTPPLPARSLLPLSPTPASSPAPEHVFSLPDYLP
jgi:hypothetical protein